jgi:hypothetical protein
VRIGRDALRAQVWPLPTIGVVLAVLASPRSCSYVG